MCFLIMDYKQKYLHIQHQQTQQPTRSFINPIIIPVQNFLKRIVKTIFEVNHCFSSRIKINRSKLYISILFVFSQRNFHCYLIFKTLISSNNSLNKSLMLDLLASNCKKGSFESITSICNF